MSTPKRDVLTRPAPLAEQADERLMTVGELLDRVQWQFPEENIQKNVLNLDSIPRPHDVSRN